MTDVEKVVEKNVEQKRHPRVVNFLKESIGATTITKRIWALVINLIIGEILA